MADGFDLDDVGSKRRELIASQRSGKDIRQIKDADPVQWIE